MNKVYVVPVFDTEGPSNCEYKGKMHGYSNWGKFKAWAKLEKSLDEVVCDKFRQDHADSYGQPVRYTWTWLDWIGFAENPRNQFTGFHGVYDHLKSIFGDNMIQYADGDALHYHNPRPDGSWFPSAKYPYEQWNRNFEQAPILQILAHYLIDKNWFPTVFRAGGTIEDNVLSSFLEQHIPIDFSSRGNTSWFPPNPASEKEILFDWRGSPDDWSYYHPDKADYRKPGSMKRVIFMSLDQGKLHSERLLSQERVRKGFMRAANGQTTVISFFSHDFVPDKKEAIEQAYEWILQSAKETGIQWEYADALAAAKQATEKTNTDLPEIKFDSETVTFESNKKLFGLPFAAAKTRIGQYIALPISQSGSTYHILGVKGIGKVHVSATDTDFNNITQEFHV